MKYLPWVLATIAGVSGWYAFSQTAVNPAPSAAACAYNSSPPTATSGTFIIVQCDSTGKLQVH